MPIFKIPKVAVFIPGATSRTKFVPEYIYPLFKKLHPKVADPVGNPLRIVPHPADVKTYTAFWHEIEAEDLDAAMRQELMSLRREFGLDAKTQDYVFDTVYTDETFATAFSKAWAAADVLAQDPARKDPADEIAGVCAEVGLDHKIARRLTTMGYINLDALAMADLDQLATVIGKVRAGRLIQVVNKKIDALIDATPAEQIAGAKAKAK